eukprot:SAG22_NODE_10574_length_527_cov_0.841121_1_plen_61_part_10
MFKSIDTNGDKSIDTNGDGLLDAAEVTAAAAALGCPFDSEEAAAEAFSELGATNAGGLVDE